MKSQTFPTEPSANRRICSTKQVHHGGGGNRTRATFPTVEARPWHHGKLLFASIVVLAAVPLFSLELGRYALGVLGLISVLACLPVHRQSKNLGAAPKRVRVKP